MDTGWRSILCASVSALTPLGGWQKDIRPAIFCPVRFSSEIRVGGGRNPGNSRTPVRLENFPLNSGCFGDPSSHKSISSAHCDVFVFLALHKYNYVLTYLLIHCLCCCTLFMLQVVAGLNYCIRFSASANCSTHQCQVQWNSGYIFLSCSIFHEFIPENYSVDEWVVRSQSKTDLYRAISRQRIRGASYTNPH